MNKWWLIVTVGLLFVACVVDSKKKWKVDEDFEFDEENSKTKNIGKFEEKKKWIHDPNSDLCKPLQCKKKELCLLEDSFTAVCVSKKEIHKNGDVIISQEKFMAEEAARKKALEEALAEDEDDEDDDDDIEDYEEDDIFYDSGISGSVLTNNRCNPCPVMKPTFLCGSDNRTYSSLCRLDYHNCLHTTNIKVNCKGFCPCKEQEDVKRKKQKQAERITNFRNKYKATLEMEKLMHSRTSTPAPLYEEKYIFAPEDFKYENKHYQYIKYIKTDNKISKEKSNAEKMSNEISDNKEPDNNSGIIWYKECDPKNLLHMGDRLLDWFSVIMTDTKRRRIKNKGKDIKFMNGCKLEVRWMYQHLDVDSDGKLSLQELYNLEHDKNEVCIKNYLSTCDTDDDIFISPDEWCRCFDKTDRPCTAIKRRILSATTGYYVPACDAQGYYEHTQCHSSVGVCWCVDKHGVEVPNSRVQGKPNCSALWYGKEDGHADKSMYNGVLDRDVDVDDEDGDSEIEGSADQSLGF